MTQVVKFPDTAWAQLATLADKRQVRIADLLVDAARYLLHGALPEPVPCRLEHVRSKTNVKGRPPQLDWRDPAVAVRVRELHAMHRTVGDSAAEFDVSWAAMRTAYRHLGITPHSAPKPKENQAYDVRGALGPPDGRVGHPPAPRTDRSRTSQGGRSVMGEQIKDDDWEWEWRPYDDLFRAGDGKSATEVVEEALRAATEEADHA
jgi:hypothetical protein